MDIELTRHAAARLTQRGIDPLWVKRVVSAPEWRESDRGDPNLHLLFGRIAECGGRVLRVVIFPLSEQRCRVITAFFDRDAANPEHEQEAGP